MLARHLPCRLYLYAALSIYLLDPLDPSGSNIRDVSVSRRRMVSNNCHHTRVYGVSPQCLLVGLPTLNDARTGGRFRSPLARRLTPSSTAVMAIVASVRVLRIVNNLVQV